MGKQDIIDFLKKCDKKGLPPQTANQIAEATGVNINTAGNVLRKMRLNNEVKYRELKYWGYGRRTYHVYYI
jgi:hypothetical protein